MARERLTQRSKRADDPIEMSRDTKNPPAEKYNTGDSSTFGEDVYEKKIWEANDRAETGHPAEVKQNYGPGVKEAAFRQAKALKAKALKCVRIAECLLPRTTEASLEEQGMDLMELSDRAVEATIARIAEMGQDEKFEEMGAKEDDKEEDKFPIAKEEEKEDEVMKEARSLLAKAKKLIADAEAEKEHEEEMAQEDMEEEAMSETEKKANVFVKKAKELVAAYESESRPAVAQAIKKEASGFLAQAKEILAGEAVKDDSVPPTLAAEKDEKEAEKAPELPVAAEKEETLEEKKARALTHLQAARKIMADLGIKEDEKDEKAMEGLEDMHPKMQEQAKKLQEASETEEEASGEPVVAKDDAEIEMEEKEPAMDDADGDIDMMATEADDEVAALFMSPEMEEAKEAYEKAFGDGEEEGEKEEKLASKTASKKGAKSLKAGIKISSVKDDANELSSLWDCPPDVSHLFK